MKKTIVQIKTEFWKAQRKFFVHKKIHRTKTLPLILIFITSLVVYVYKGFQLGNHPDTIDFLTLLSLCAFSCFGILLFTPWYITRECEKYDAIKKQTPEYKQFLQSEIRDKLSKLVNLDDPKDIIRFTTDIMSKKADGNIYEFQELLNHLNIKLEIKGWKAYYQEFSVGEEKGTFLTRYTD